MTALLTAAVTMTASLAVKFFLLCASLFPGLVSSACPSGYTEVGGGCFQVHADAQASFIEARQLCQDNGGDLALVKDCALLGELASFFASLGIYTGGSVRSIWIGGNDLVNEVTWRWLDSTIMPLGAPFWGRAGTNISVSFEEPSGGTAENCAAMSVGAGFYFQDLNCGLSSGYAPLCQVSPLDGSCPTPYVPVGGSCLEYLPTVDVSWEDARVVCQTNGGDLAIIDDCHLMLAAINYARENGLVPQKGFWIGGSDIESEGTWIWVDGSSMAMGTPFWGRSDVGPLQPDNLNDQDCLQFFFTPTSDRYYWDDDHCEFKEGVLCQSDVI